MESESFGLIRVDEVLEAIDAGEIIEEYPEDEPYPSCLIFGRTGAKRPLHIVCAPVLAEQRLVVITTYQPDPDRWEADFKRGNDDEMRDLQDRRGDEIAGASRS
jgi:hypothetical protein